MRSVIRFVMTLLMPIILLAGGGAMAGWGIENEWQYVVWSGMGMMAGGLIWGLFLWFWIDGGTW